MNYKIRQEPKKSFPYKPPSNYIKKKYSYIFNINTSIKPKVLKYFFDKLISLFFLIISLPIILIIKILYVIEGILIPENKGPLFFFV